MKFGGKIIKTSYFGKYMSQIGGYGRKKNENLSEY